MFARLLAAGEIYGDLGKLVLRVGLGASMLLAHGIPKIQGWEEKSAVFADPFGVGPSTRHRR